MVLLCFYSGKVVLTGGKNLHDIQNGWDMLWKIVKSYVKKGTPIVHVRSSSNASSRNGIAVAKKKTHRTEQV